MESNATLAGTIPEASFTGSGFRWHIQRRLYGRIGTRLHMGGRPIMTPRANKAI